MTNHIDWRGHSTVVQCRERSYHHLQPTASRIDFKDRGMLDEAVITSSSDLSPPSRYGPPVVFLGIIPFPLTLLGQSHRAYTDLYVGLELDCRCYSINASVI
jgi:hypothetical protein